ncbi:putative cytochrome P450 1A1-like [Apostichopus japonicus]|uniref:Putative cytochrome P450 1A1-like n=1 Tax=Stichopus japonicus TaxID=307972 RepID=A0A2G8L4L2_STIJA|nr:putative cytochrome P450 1A1-like [Apostichopus japonicus]
METLIDQSYRSVLYLGSWIETTSASLSFILTILAVFMMVKSIIGSRQKKSIPLDAREVPGPIGFPIIGNILQLGTVPHVSFVELAKKYGDVFRIRIGSRSVIVLNGRQAIHQALVRQSVDFAGRPGLNAFQTSVALNGGSVAFTTYDEGWKLHRKIADNALHHFTSGKQSVLVEQQVTFEATEFIRFVMNKNNAVIIDPTKLLKLSVSNIMASFLFQVRHELDHEELKSIVNNNDLFVDAFSGNNMIDFMPWLGVIFPGKMKSFTELATKFRNIHKVYIKNHLDNYEHGLDSDIMYYLMTLSEGIDPKQRQELKLTDERIRSVVYDFFGAGFETVASTLMWAFLYAIYFPDLQKRMQEEMDDVIGRDRLPSLQTEVDFP